MALSRPEQGFEFPMGHTALQIFTIWSAFHFLFVQSSPQNEETICPGLQPEVYNSLRIEVIHQVAEQIACRLFIVKLCLCYLRGVDVITGVKSSSTMGGWSERGELQRQAVGSDITSIERVMRRLLIAKIV